MWTLPEDEEIPSTLIPILFQHLSHLSISYDNPGSVPILLGRLIAPNLVGISLSHLESDSVPLEALLSSNNGSRLRAVITGGSIITKNLPRILSRHSNLQPLEFFDCTIRNNFFVCFVNIPNSVLLCATFREVSIKFRDFNVDALLVFWRRRAPPRRCSLHQFCEWVLPRRPMINELYHHWTSHAILKVSNSSR